LAKYETSDYAQMRRCRMAHLYGRRVDEHFKNDDGGVLISGYIQAIRPELTCWPLQWTITIGQHSAQETAMAMVD
jgi:hypothetical protein